ncbi:MAG: metalloprotease PmbA [Methylococcales symbiont of Hymedesmia sp. n. MRB-2018]|nr:MAG: metalloprotease PmbA [Methylococcales symbiont of Hymedesmia sp. n. MRB-2018]
MQNYQEINRLKNLAQDLLYESKNQGATSAEASLSVDNGLSVTARLGEVETIEYHCDQSLDITVYKDKKKGSASTNDFSLNSIKETVKAACSIANFSSEDEYAGLPEKAMLATQFPDFDNNHDWNIDAESALQLAIECEYSARTFHPEISNSEGATINTHQGISVLANSLGFLHGGQTTRHSISCSVLAERDGNMQRDYWYSVASNANNLESVAEIGIKAAQRTISRLGSRSLATRQCPVLYSAEVASGLIASLIAAISGGSLYRKSSFLLDALDTQIFPDFIRIHEQPHLKNGLASTAYDAEAVATKTRDIVTAGVLKGYVLSSYSARKLGLQTTGNAGGVHNLTVASGGNDFTAMLKQLNTGLLVTELMGQGVNRVTGDYSRGASGFWVENGQIQYPVEEITIAGNLKDMYKNIVSVGNDMDYRSNIRTGSILIEQMAIAGE